MLKSLCSTIIIIAFLSVSFSAFAGKVEKAYEALSIHNYFKAKKLFEKKWEKNKAAASFGLSVIYGRNNNPFYNLDSAHLYVELAAINYQLLEEKKRLKLKVIGVDSSAIDNWSDSVDLKAYRRSLKKNTISHFESYMLAYVDSKYQNQAKQKRDSLVFLSVKKEGNSKAYSDFLESYPNSYLSNEAKKALNNSLFNELLEKDELLAYQNFEKKYPFHPKKLVVQDSIYAKSTGVKTIANYERFILKNPNNRNTSEAWRNIYKLFTSSYSPQIIQDFKESYPNYPFRKELEQDYTLSQELLLPFKANGKWGFMTKSGQVRIIPIYAFAEEFSEGLAIVKRDGKFGFIDKSGEVVIPFQYNEAFSFKNGTAIVSKNDLFGLINRVNDAIAPFVYEFIEPFNSGTAVVATSEGYGFINNKGEELHKYPFDYASNFSNDYAIVDSAGRKALINNKMEFVIPFVYSKLSLPEDSLVIAKNDSLYGIINLKGDTLIPFEYTKIDNFSEGLALIVKDGKYGYVNNSTEISIPIIYVYNSPASIWGKFNNGFAKFQRKGKFGIIDKSGQELSPAIFENLEYFSKENLFPVKKKGLWGYANFDLKLKIKYTYQEADKFSPNGAIVKNDTAYGVISKKGEWLIKPQYSQITQLNDSLYRAAEINSGLLNFSGEIILPFVYSRIINYNHNLLLLEKENDTYYFNLITQQIIKLENEL